MKGGPQMFFAEKLRFFFIFRNHPVRIGLTVAVSQELLALI
jgi:hypothetical protein